ncbi:MAG: homoserine dehydrogenase [Candidatus Micrarchaeia archaeon]
MEKIGIGMIGLGTVGQGVLDKINKKNELNLQVKKIAVRDLSKKRKISLENTLTDKIENVVDNKEINIVVEVAGGNQVLPYLIHALESGKHVVTANKALLAEKGAELSQAAKKGNANLYFEASVGGGIPIINQLYSGFSKDQVNEITGIVNGTCNFVLGQMEKGKSFEDAVKDAQEKGFAEADPTADVDGHDAAQKLSIITSLAFGKMVPTNKIHTEGIRKITQSDIKYAKENNYAIKLIAVAKKTKGKIEARVNPTMIPQGSILANVKNEQNAFEVKSQSRNHVYIGEGAGQKPTASAVADDIMNLAKHITQRTLPKTQYFEIAKAEEIGSTEDLEFDYYLRFSAENKPGVLAKIATKLYESNINIEKVTQDAKKKEKTSVKIIISHTKEKDLKKATEALNKIPNVKLENSIKFEP